MDLLIKEIVFWDMILKSYPSDLMWTTLKIEVGSSSGISNKLLTNIVFYCRIITMTMKGSNRAQH